MKYIFVHIPKTAGTSFRVSLSKKLSCLWDYGPESPTTSPEVKSTVYADAANQLPDIAAKEDIGFISGHFPAAKYKDMFPEAGLIAFVRAPVNRVISEYNHHVRFGGFTQSLEAFCKMPGQRNKQAKCFSGLSVSDFFFVGLTERYAQSLAQLNEKSGLGIEELKMNRAKNQDRNPLEKTRDQLSEEQIRMIRRQNKEDMDLYRSVRATFLEVSKV